MTGSVRKHHPRDHRGTNMTHVATTTPPPALPSTPPVHPHPHYPHPHQHMLSPPILALNSGDSTSKRSELVRGNQHRHEGMQGSRVERGRAGLDVDNNNMLTGDTRGGWRHLPARYYKRLQCTRTSRLKSVFSDFVRRHDRACVPVGPRLCFSSHGAGRQTEQHEDVYLVERATTMATLQQQQDPMEGRWSRGAVQHDRSLKNLVPKQHRSRRCRL